MTDDSLIQAAAVAESRLPGGTGKYVAMMLGWEARTREPFSAHTQIAEKLAAAVLAAPSHAVDREALVALFRAAPGRERLGDQTPGEIADALLARYDIRERGETG